MHACLLFSPSLYHLPCLYLGCTWGGSRFQATPLTSLPWKVTYTSSLVYSSDDKRLQELFTSASKWARTTRHHYCLVSTLDVHTRRGPRLKAAPSNFSLGNNLPVLLGLFLYLQTPVQELYTEPEVHAFCSHHHCNLYLGCTSVVKEEDEGSRQLAYLGK
jgi:hypothetical protein